MFNSQGCLIPFSHHFVPALLKASKKYLSVARQMKEYEDKKYEAWKEQVEANLLIYLKKNLLTKPSTSSATTHRSVADEGASSEDASGSLVAAVQSQGTYSSFLTLLANNF